MKLSRSPTIAMLWSICIPGFGQLYNRDFIAGLLLVVLEFAINVNAHLNLAILYSFRGQVILASQVTDYQWLLFYPCVYAYSMWQAYNKALEINQEQAGEQGVAPTNTRYNGHFIGCAMGGTLGVIYMADLGPVFGGILGMFTGAGLGWLIERTMTRNSPII